MVGSGAQAGAVLALGHDPGLRERPVLEPPHTDAALLRRKASRRPRPNPLDHAEKIDRFTLSACLCAAHNKRLLTSARGMLSAQGIGAEINALSSCANPIQLPEKFSRSLGVATCYGLLRNHVTVIANVGHLGRGRAVFGAAGRSCGACWPTFVSANFRERRFPELG